MTICIRYVPIETQKKVALVKFYFRKSNKYMLFTNGKHGSLLLLYIRNNR
jgi:hypothetical protein